MRKKAMSSVLAAGLVMGTLGVYTPSAFAASNQLSVVIGGKSYNLNQAMNNDRTYVQLHSLQDAFNADIEYDGPTQVVTVTRSDVVIKIDLKTNKATLNGAEIKDFPTPYLDTKTNRTMVPLRAFSELFGQDVAWDGTTNTVTIVPSKQLTDQENKIKDILDSADKAVAAKSGMHMGITMNMDMSGLNQTDGNQQGSAIPMPDTTSNISLKGTFDGDAIVKPSVAMHLNGQMTVPMGMLNQSLATEIYMQDGTMYMNNPMTHQWEKMQLMSHSEWQQLINATGTGSSSQDQQTQDLMLPFMKLSDDTTNNAYVITTYLNNTLLNKLQQSSAANDAAAVGNSQANVASDQMPNFGKLLVSITIDKTTNLEKEISFEMSMNAPSGQTGSVDMTMDMKMDFDHFNPVTIPDDVVKNAVDMNGAGGLSGAVVLAVPTSPSQN